MVWGSVYTTLHLYYNKRVYVPVISVGLEHDLKRIPYEKKLLPGSYLSGSLLSGLMHGKHCLGLPYYRQSAELCRQGIPITRQTMISWNNRFAKSERPRTPRKRDLKLIS